MSIAAFAFVLPRLIRFGRGEANKASTEIAVPGARVLLVTGGNTERAGWLRDSLARQGCEVTFFSVPGEPDLATVENGTTVARSAGTTRVVALGGGSAIDAGKAIAALAPAPRPVLDHLEVVGKGLPLEVAPLPFVALPTTAGTGAEVTRNAVISVPEHRRKVSMRDAAMLADIAIADPALTDGCPRAITLASGLDAVTQVIEPYISRRANPMTDAICATAIPRGLAALRTLMEESRPPPEARDEMAWTSLCGGIALANSGLGAVHGLAGPLGGLSGAAHGAICGILLPPTLEMNGSRITDPVLLSKLDQIRGWIAAALGGAPKDSFDRLAQWSAEMGLPGLVDQGVSDDAMAAAARAAAQSSSMKANPVVLDEQELDTILAAAR